MATHKSALKRMRQNAKRGERNKSARSRMRTAIKKAGESLASGDMEVVEKNFRDTQKIIATVVQKGVIAAKTGSRYISRLATAINKSSKN